jgi:hypothetical protein
LTGIIAPKELMQSVEMMANVSFMVVRVRSVVINEK